MCIMYTWVEGAQEPSEKLEVKLGLFVADTGNWPCA